MNKLKKSLSVILTLVMLFTIVSSGLSALAATNVKYSDSWVDEAIIAVPETVYMTPSTGESKTGQYYVNNTIDKATKKITTEASATNENAYVEVYAPGAKELMMNGGEGSMFDGMLDGMFDFAAETSVADVTESDEEDEENYEEDED